MNLGKGVWQVSSGCRTGVEKYPAAPASKLQKHLSLRTLEFSNKMPAILVIYSQAIQLLLLSELYIRA